MPKDMMPNMKGYGQSYNPQGGSAGGEAKGEYSHKKNPRPVPRKGSQIAEGSAWGNNADRSKVMRLEKEQSRNESLRGEGC